MTRHSDESSLGRLVDYVLHFVVRAGVFRFMFHSPLGVAVTAVGVAGLALIVMAVKRDRRAYRHRR